MITEKKEAHPLHSESVEVFAVMMRYGNPQLFGIFSSYEKAVAAVGGCVDFIIEPWLLDSKTQIRTLF